MLMEDHKLEVKQADSFLVLACGQGIHTVIDATEPCLLPPLGGEDKGEGGISR
jgi:hypothetical protein